MVVRLVTSKLKPELAQDFEKSSSSIGQRFFLSLTNETFIVMWHVAPSFHLPFDYEVKHID